MQEANYPRVKRVLDLSGAVFGITVTAPLFAIIVFALWLFQGRPVFFVQIRPGLKGKPFKLLKFRTMSHVGMGPMNDSSQETITRFGRILRKLSLDELPQLINVALGQMSFVGPRPLLVEYLPLYSVRQSLRHNVRPGLTGLAQINGRNLQSWDERLEMDADYAERMCFSLDLSIVYRSFWTVLSGKGVSPSGSELMERFQGPNGQQ